MGTAKMSGFFSNMIQPLYGIQIGNPPPTTCPGPQPLYGIACNPAPFPFPFPTPTPTPGPQPLYGVPTPNPNPFPIPCLGPFGFIQMFMQMIMQMFQNFCGGGNFFMR